MTHITRKLRNTVSLLALSALLGGAIPAIADSPMQDQQKLRAQYENARERALRERREARAREEASRREVRRDRDRDRRDRRDYDRERGRDRRDWGRDHHRDRWGNDHPRRWDRRHYRDPWHSSRPWHNYEVRNGLFFHLGNFLDWRFSIPNRLVVDRYDDYYWGAVNHRGRSYDIYLFPVYHADRVEYVPYAYRNGRLVGRGRVMGHGSGPSLNIVLDF